jgi:LysM repeat protein
MSEFRFSGTGTIPVGNTANATTLQTALRSQLLLLNPNYVVVTAVSFHGFVFSFGVENGNLEAVNYALSRTFSQYNIESATVVNNTPTNTPANTNNSNDNIWIVESGDTLSRIAFATGNTVANLINLNSSRYPSLRTNPNNINIGWQLIVKNSNSTTNNIPVITGNQAQTVINQNQQTTGQNLPVINPVNNNTDNSGFDLNGFAAKLGVSVSVLAVGAVVIFVVASKK